MTIAEWGKIFRVFKFVIASRSEAIPPNSFVVNKIATVASGDLAMTGKGA